MQVKTIWSVLVKTSLGSKDSKLRATNRRPKLQIIHEKEHQNPAIVAGLVVFTTANKLKNKSDALIKRFEGNETVRKQ